MQERNWGKFYDWELEIPSFIHTLNVHRDLLELLVAERPRRILEVGCGTATMSFFLSLLGYEVVCVDNDKKVLNKAMQSSKKFKANVEFINADAFSLPFGIKEFDVAFSQGLLEHFCDNDIKRIVSEKARVAKSAVISVPNKFYRTKDFGNERLLSKKDWERILSNFQILESRDYFYTRMKKNLLIKLPVMYMCKLRSRQGR